MSSSKLLGVVACLLCLAVLALAEKPNDKPNDPASRANLQQYQENGPHDVGGKTLEEWRKDLTNPDPSIRAAAIMAIPNFRRDAANVVPDLLKRLHDGDASPRAKTAIALRLIMPYIKPADHTRVIQELGRTIRGDQQLIIRYEAARTYKEFCQYRGPIHHEIKEEHETIHDLLANVGLVSNSTFELRDACIEALIYAGVDPKNGPDPAVTKALINRANFQYESTERVRLKAIMALGAMGRPQSPTDYEAVKNILKSRNNYNSSHPTVKIWAHVAVIALDEKADKKDLDTIAEYLKDRKAEVRYQAVTALGALEDKAESYVANICDLVTKGRGESDPQVMSAIATSLGRMKNKGDRVKSALIKLTEDDDQDHINPVMAACIALTQLGFSDGETNTAIKKALDHRSLTGVQKLILEKALADAKEMKTKQKEPKKLDKGAVPGAGKPQPNKR